LVILFSDLLASLRLFDPFVCRSRLGGICGHVIAHWLGRGQREVNCLTRSLFPSPLFGQEVLTSFSLHFSCLCLPCPQGESISRPGPRTTFCNSILRPGDSILMQLEASLFFEPSLAAGKSITKLQAPRVECVCGNKYGIREHLLRHIPLCCYVVCPFEQADGSYPETANGSPNKTHSQLQAGRQENTLRLFRLNAQHSLKFNK